jgi:biotin transport system substrate-specific component
MGALREVAGRGSAAGATRSGFGRRALSIAAGALVVAVAAQAAVPVPFSPVPMTLQPLAVLVVGGLLGAAGGAAALATYLGLGVLGLPVFAGGSGGIVHLLGPTGGYLLAFPAAAALTGALADGGTGVLRVLLACAAGMVLIHAGGVSQLALLGGDPAAAFRIGFVPFLTGDLLKVGLAAGLILALRPVVRRAR